jgi:prolyl-tRNA synthetase
MSDDKKLTSRDADFSAWYNEVVLRSELADYSPVKGCMVIRPYGYAIWELIQRSSAAANLPSHTARKATA